MQFYRDFNEAYERFRQLLTTFSPEAQRDLEATTRLILQGWHDARRRMTVAVNIASTFCAFEKVIQTEADARALLPYALEAVANFKDLSWCQTRIELYRGQFPGTLKPLQPSEHSSDS